MRVDIERVQELINERNQINRTPLADLEIYEDGVRLTIRDDALRYWRRVGLNNTDFIEMRIWEGEIPCLEPFSSF